MKTKFIIWITFFIGMGFILLLTNNCKKDLGSTVIFIGEDTDTNFYTASVTIGTQVWMTKNLKVRRFRNGDKIWSTTPATLDITDEVTPKHQWAYDADEINVDSYGRLYTWYAITDIRGYARKDGTYLLMRTGLSLQPISRANLMPAVT